MIETRRSSAGRRSPEPPPALVHELVRTRLISALARRFDVDVTVVQAGAGFGKTTAIAQAIRANLSAPRGIDAWVSCEPGDENPNRLAAAIVASLGAASGSADPLEAVLDAVAAVSPLDVCLVLDDLHEVPPDSAAARLLRDVVRRLPPNTHLLLASRDPAPIPLARLRAAGKVAQVGADDLAFTGIEADVLAETHGQDPGGVGDYAGWPSLVRLALSAPAGATRQFLFEEVIGELTADQRTALAVLATMGWGSADDLARVAADPIDLEGLATKVPLVRHEDDGRFVIHQLWEDPVTRLFDAGELEGLRDRALKLLLARGETVRAGMLAARWGRTDSLARASRAFVRETLGALPIDTAHRWLTHAPDDIEPWPDLELLALATRHAQRADTTRLDERLDHLAKGFADRGDIEGEAVTLAFGTVVAHFRGDNLRLLALADRVSGLPEADRHPVLRFLVDSVAAALAALSGDGTGALAILERLDLTDVPPSTTELVTRLHVNMLVYAGRADEAVVLGEPLSRSLSTHVRRMPDHLRWLAHDPSPFRDGRPPIDAGDETNERDRFFHAGYTTAMATSFGDHGRVAALRPVVEAVATRPSDARDSAIAAIAIACERLLDHDEPGAVAAIADHLDRHPIDEPLSEMHLSRFPAISYVCCPDVRARWDSALCGPSHQRSLSAARDLLAARDGSLGATTTLQPPNVVFTTLPLPWSAELTALALDAGAPAGEALAFELAAWAPRELAIELTWLGEHGTPRAASGARLASALLPDPSRPRVVVRLIGPAEVDRGDSPSPRSEIRRARVRTLLALLAMAGPIRRERVTDLMWPELDSDAAARNLRVTLSRLRGLLDPDRPAGTPCPYLREVGETLALAPPPFLDVDVWQLREAATLAERAQREGNPAEAVSLLEHAAGLWRGEPLGDLEAIDELAPDVAEIRRSLIDVTIRLGEWRFLAGRFDEAHSAAQRALTASAYDERAHRLAIASLLQTGDREGLRLAVTRVEAALRELDVPPEPATQMLIRQAAARDERPTRD